MLSNNFKQVVSSVVDSSISLDSNSKDLFMLAYNEYLKVSSEHLASTNKDIKEYLKKEIQSDSVRSGIVKVINVAYKYSKLKAITHLDEMTYDNICKVVTLLSFIDKEHNDKLKTVKNKLSRVKGIENYTYNNNIRAKVLELRKEYKVIVTEDGEVVKLSSIQVVNSVANNIEALTEEDRAKLVALLTA